MVFVLFLQYYRDQQEKAFYSRSLSILGTTADITEHLEEQEEEEQVCWPFTPIDMHSYNSSGALTLRSSFNGYYNPSLWVLSISSKRRKPQSQNKCLLKLGQNLTLCGIRTLSHKTEQAFRSRKLQGEIFHRKGLTERDVTKSEIFVFLSKYTNFSSPLIWFHLLISIHTG